MAPSFPARAADATAPEPSLAIGMAVQGELTSGSTRAYRLDLPADHVVQAVFEGQGTILDLQDAHGRHLRRLGRADQGVQELMWVSSEASRRLVVSSIDGGTGGFRLALTGTLAPAAGASPATDRALPSPRLRALGKTLAAGGDTEAFWQERAMAGTPMIEPLSTHESLVTFLWRGDESNVRLFGSPSGNHDPLARLGNSDVWWASFRMPNTARLSYRIAPDVPSVRGTAMEQRRVILATAQRDPLNSRIFPALDESRVDRYQGASVLELPQAPPQPWAAARSGVEKGVLQHHRLESVTLGNARDVWIYRPAGAAPRALLVLFDGHAYLKQVPAPVIIDNLVADGLLPPTALVLIGNADAQARGRELPPNPAFAAFLDRELMPWLKEQGIAAPADRTVVAGSSFGGLASAFAGLVNARWFGNVLSLSGSYWWAPSGEAPGWMMRRYAEAPLHKVRFYLDAGRYEGSRGGRDGILETTRHLGDVLRAKGYEVTQVEHDSGHDYLHWQGSLGCGLIALLRPELFAGVAKTCGGHAPS